MKKIMSVKDFKFEQGVVCRNMAEVQRMRGLFINLGHDCFIYSDEWVFFPYELEQCDLRFAKSKGFDLVEYSDTIIVEDYFRDVKFPLSKFPKDACLVCRSRSEYELLQAYADAVGFRTPISGKKLSELPMPEGLHACCLYPTRTEVDEKTIGTEAPSYQEIYFDFWRKGATIFTTSYVRYIPIEGPTRLAPIPLKDFKDNWTIWCDTEAEWDELMELGTSAGVKWRSGSQLTAYGPYNVAGTGFLPAGDGTPLRATFEEYSDTQDYLYIRFKDWKAGSRIFSVDGLDSSKKLDITNELPATEAPTAEDLMKSLEKATVAETTAPYDFRTYMQMLRDRGLDPKEVPAEVAGTDKPTTTFKQQELDYKIAPYQKVSQDNSAKTTGYWQADWSCPAFASEFEISKEILKDQISPQVLEKVNSAIGSVSSPAKKEDSMLAPLVFVSSAVRRAAWSALDWAFVSPIKKTVKPVGTVAQFTICYTTLALIGYLAYSAYSDPTAMVSWISDLSPVEIRFKQPQE